MAKMTQLSAAAAAAAVASAAATAGTASSSAGGTDALVQQLTAAKGACVQSLCLKSVGIPHFCLGPINWQFYDLNEQSCLLKALLGGRLALKESTIY